jgi:alkanesulfonate monooxygenase SsuD/methylene tetrahydromethanopterin reductase-like flavin-dependent oxidoreductase (luciferase family)
VDLSILHFGHVGAVVDFMNEADDLGYARLWLGEHHSHWQCTNPLLLGALLAATSGGIRIGSGGVCLDYQSPLRIAEDARLIEYMLPGRFDLGVTRGLKLPPETRDAMLDGRPPEALRPYDEKLAAIPPEIEPERVNPERGQLRGERHAGLPQRERVDDAPGGRSNTITSRTSRRACAGPSCAPPWRTSGTWKVIS